MARVFARARAPQPLDGGVVTGRTPWTEGEDAALYLMWIDPEVSTRQIGEALGRSRNAVIGRANRLGLSPKKSAYGKRRKTYAKGQWLTPPKAFKDAI